MSKVYGFIGVIGGGKSYTANLYRQKACIEGRSVIEVDFSDAIRDFVYFVITGQRVPVNTLSQEYAMWKKMRSTVFLPHKAYDFCSGGSLASVSVTGREMLQRVGEEIKHLAGDDVWARTAADRALAKFAEMSETERDNCDILFGSLRFIYEAKEMFRVAAETGKEAQIILCDYHSDAYEINNHESERLAQSLIGIGRHDGDDVTDIIQARVEMYRWKN